MRALFEKFVIYTDGACSGNPGPGGWGAILYHPKGYVMELGGSQSATTNNQMELKAVIEALRKMQNQKGECIIYTDSVYVIRGITQWIFGWMRKGWINAEGLEVSNKEYWQELHRLVQSLKGQVDLSWKFVKGHAGQGGNERCDEIAVAYSKKQPIQLYSGSLFGYDIPIMDFPPERPLPDMKAKEAKPKALYYLSYVNGVIERHPDWAQCERRVKGQSGARFKKINSEDEEASVLKSWGIG